MQVTFQRLLVYTEPGLTETGFSWVSAFHNMNKSLEQNNQVMNELEKLSVMELPVLVGVSRKSMIYKKLGYTPNESLCGTVVLNTVALMKGASILRVHDVREAVDAVKIVKSLNG